MRRGMVRHSRGKYAGSVADFNEALLLDPNDKHAKKLRDHSAAREREVLLKFCTLYGQPLFLYLVRGRQAYTKHCRSPALHTGANQHRTMYSLVALKPIEIYLMDRLVKPQPCQRIGRPSFLIVR